MILLSRKPILFRRTNHILPNTNTMLKAMTEIQFTEWISLRSRSSIKLNCTNSIFTNSHMAIRKAVLEIILLESIALIPRQSIIECRPVQIFRDSKPMLQTTPKFVLPDRMALISRLKIQFSRLI
jgi:hypothetical protein